MIYPYTIKDIKLHIITAQWRPSMAFKLRMKPAQKRLLHRFHRLKVYRERLGRPLPYFGDRLANEEIRRLRITIRGLVEFLLSSDPADIKAGISELRGRLHR
jgi:hypothetical protein